MDRCRSRRRGWGRGRGRARAGDRSRGWARARARARARAKVQARGITRHLGHPNLLHLGYSSLECRVQGKRGWGDGEQT